MEEHHQQWRNPELIADLDYDDLARWPAQARRRISPFTWTAPFPGDSCEIVVVFASKTNSTAMRLQRFSAPPGITGVLGADCGKTIQPADPATPAASVLLTVDPGAVAGQVITFGPDTQGSSG